MRLLPLILLPALLITPARADPDELTPLVQQLSSDDYATREDATQKLVRLGEPALPRLQQLLPLTTDGEARNRIQSAIDQIGESSVAGETLLSLDFTDADPTAVFAELAKQSHATINTSPSDVIASLPKITFHCDHEPFWPALRRLCSPLGLQPELLAANGMGMVRRPQQLSTDHALTLVRSTSGAWDKTPTTFAGPFMISVQQITQTGVVVPATDQRTHSLVIQCSVYAEPKLTVLGRNGIATVSDPDPDANPPGHGGFANGIVNPRIPFGARNYYNYNSTAASAWPLVIPLLRPANATDKLPHLQATTTAKVLLRAESWEVANITHVAPRTWTVAGRAVSVKSVTWEGTNVKLIATAAHKRDRTPNIGANDDYAIFNSVELLTADGRSLPALTRSPVPSDNPAALVAYSIQFDSNRDGLPLTPPKTPLRLRWRIPLESKDLTLPIEFTNLPLP